MMSRLQKGMVAGFAATAVVSAMEAVNILVLKQYFAPFPLIIADMVGLGSNMAVGWAIHVAIGVLVLGPLFGFLLPKLPTDTPETKGIAFAVGAFVVMLIGFTMLGDYATFGRNFGTIGWMLGTNAVFGVVLGNVYARLTARDRRQAANLTGAPAH